MIRTILLSAAAFAAPIALAAAPAQAQVGGIAVANPEAAVANSRAWATARGQIETTYKAQLDQANARRDAISRELQPLINTFNTARTAPNANQASLQTQAQAIQTREQAGQAELQRLTLPAQRAQAYALEQISTRLPDAVTAVTRARNINLLLRPDAALFAQPAADVTAQITTELDRLVPSVSTAVPANWQPGQQRGAGAASTTAPAVGTRPAAPAPARRPSGR